MIITLIKIRIKLIDKLKYPATFIYCNSLIIPMEKKVEPRHSTRLHSLFTIIIIFLIVYASAFITCLFKTDTWYKNLKKPEIMPPDYAFPIAWYSLFFLLAVSIILLWRDKAERPHITLLFGINLLLVIIWSVFFFGLHQPTLAFLEILLLVIATLGTFIYSYQIRKISSLLLIPYLLWVLFLAYVNYQIAFILY